MAFIISEEHQYAVRDVLETRHHPLHGRIFILSYSEFLSLPEDYKQKYRMETENGRVVSYTDKKGFFIFMKP